MIQLLIALAIVAFLAVTLLSGEKKPGEQAADRRMRDMNRQTTGE